MGVSVLIVDDDESVRFFHRIVVSQNELSSRPLCFTDAQEVTNYLDQNSNRTDTYLILLDINMPGKNGWDFLDEISVKNYCNQVHIVIVTSCVDSADHEKAKSYDMVINVVEKPISDEECKRIMNFSSLAQYF